jgi:uncharacterized integral membrane protein
MTHVPVSPIQEPPVKKKKKRGAILKSPVLRLLGLIALAAIVAVFVFQNLQTVSVHFWFIKRHPPLIFVIIGCLLIGLLVGYVTGFRRGVRKTRRRWFGKRDSKSEDAERGKEEHL